MRGNTNFWNFVDYILKNPILIQLIYSVHCIHCTMYNTLYIVHYTMYTVHCTLYSVYHI